jgi:hypothetical protein
MAEIPEPGKKYPAKITEPTRKPIMGMTGDLIEFPTA